MAADALEQSVLESKDREQLVAIASALGVKSTSRAKKADLIQKILEQTGADAPPAAPAPAAPAAPTSSTPAADQDGEVEVVLGEDGEPLADWEIELLRQGVSLDTAPAPQAAPRPAQTRPAPSGPSRGVSPDGDGDSDDDAGGDDDGADGAADLGEGGETDGEGRNRRRRRRRNKNRSEGVVDGDRPDAPRAELPRNDGPRSNGGNDGQRSNGGNDGMRNDGQRGNGSNDGMRNDGQRNGGNGGNGQRERFDRNDRPDRPDRELSPDPMSLLDPVTVSGYLDLRDEGYGFLRVNGYLASRDDAYIPVKLTRQFGLRRGDHVVGLSRPAGRNEKNPALLEVHSVNGRDPELARDRPRFEDLTAVHPNVRLTLENASDPSDLTARIIDLIAPIGRGQRALVVSSPQADKTAVLKSIATAVERNHPDATLMVLLVDERPEDVTDLRRSVGGEVIASTFDRPSDEQTHVAELCIEKAKRLVEQGDDVVLLVDGLTRLSRAYNGSAPSGGRALPSGLDPAAIHPVKRFFGAARNVEEGGSLTIIATILVDTNSRLDEAIFEEFTGTANMELHLDRRLAERQIRPAIDVARSGTRHDGELLGAQQAETVATLRRSLADVGADGNSTLPLERLIARLTASRSNDDFLQDFAKRPTL